MKAMELMMEGRSVSSESSASVASTSVVISNEVDIDILVKDIVGIHSNTEISLSLKYNLIKNRRNRYFNSLIHYFII